MLQVAAFWPCSHTASLSDFCRRMFGATLEAKVASLPHAVAVVAVAASTSTSTVVAVVEALADVCVYTSERDRNSVDRLRVRLLISSPITGRLKLRRGQSSRVE